MNEKAHNKAAAGDAIVVFTGHGGRRSCNFAERRQLAEGRP